MGGVEVSPSPAGLRLRLVGPLELLSGCRQLSEVTPYPPAGELLCPVGAAPVERIRLRFTLLGGRDVVNLSYPLHGVVYAGGGRDAVSAERAYGGDGYDQLIARRAFGGQGKDTLSGANPETGTPRTPGNALFGGLGNDELRAPGRLYGGPGDDHLGEGYFAASKDMMVGGPGRDTVGLSGDGRRDVVRVRGGGSDRVGCASSALDVVFADRSDRLEDCEDATVLYTERPRYPYP